MRVLDVWRSTIGRKILMAVTGLFMVLFILAHVLGNSTFFLGPEGINAYAARLKSLGEFLWVERIFMIGVTVIHIWLGIVLSLENSKTKPKYVERRYLRSPLSARIMIYTGLIILAFVVYHLLHFTFQVTNPDFSEMLDAAGRPDVYGMGMESFQKLPIVLAYSIALIALLLHLWHGIESLFQTMGWNNDRTQPLLDRGGKTVSALVFIGFLLIPGAVYLFLG